MIGVKVLRNPTQNPCINRPISKAAIDFISIKRPPITANPLAAKKHCLLYLFN